MNNTAKDQAVLKYLDLSTANVSKATMEFLGDVSRTNAIGQTVAAYEYGAFISVPPKAEYHRDVPADLRAVLDFARNKGCAIVRLDADAVAQDDLPTFDW